GYGRRRLAFRILGVHHGPVLPRELDVRTPHRDLHTVLRGLHTVQFHAAREPADGLLEVGDRPDPGLGEVDDQLGQVVGVHLHGVAVHGDGAEHRVRLRGAGDRDLDVDLDLAVAAVGEADDLGVDAGDDLRRLGLGRLEEL